MNKRPVIVMKWSGVKKLDIGPGVFHAWGVDFHEFETGPGNFSTAIIELSTGEILNQPVELIRFTDRWAE